METICETDHTLLYTSEYGFDVFIGATEERIRNFGTLCPVMDDSTTRLTDGHYAVASITGAPISLVIAAFQLARDQSLTKAHGVPEFTDTSLVELRSALSLLGFQGEWESVSERPTVRTFAWDLADNKHLGFAWLLKLTDEVIAVTEGSVCGAHTAGKVLCSETALGRNKKVRMALRVHKFTGASVLLARSWRSSLKHTACA